MGGGFRPAVACALAVAAALPEASGHQIITEMISRRPWVFRFRNVLDSKENAQVRQAVFDAVVFFNDTAPDGSVRPGAKPLPEGDPNRPRYRMQNERQLSLYFKTPPPVMAELYRRMAAIAGVHPGNVEAIYHVYAPGALPANLHLDNFNKFMFPHRYASLSMFFDDAPDGGTIFPLLRRPDGPRVAFDTDGVEAWHRMINETRTVPTGDGYLHRRVEEDEADEFRRRTWLEALDMCKGGRAAQEPVIPVKGAAYMWRNYLDNGEDDVRTIHAGCGSSKAFKIVGTFFIRDWPGPFQEHGTFWDTGEARGPELDELQRQLEIRALNSFRLRHLERLYEQQREIAEELSGPTGLVWTLQRQRAHVASLTSDHFEEHLDASILDMFNKYAGTSLPWSRVVPVDHAF